MMCERKKFLLDKPRLRAGTLQNDLELFNQFRPITNHFCRRIGGRPKPIIE